MFALDLDRGEAGRQRAARHHMLGSNHPCPGVEIDEVAAAHIDGAEAETHILLVGVHAVEVDEALERGFERPRVKVARRLDGAARVKPWIGDARSEETLRPGARNHGGAHLIGLRARPPLVQRGRSRRSRSPWQRW